MAKKLSELYAPKAAGEKAFVAKHTEKKTTDKSPATKDDKVFKASNIKTYDRSPRHGYNKGEDEKEYGVAGEEPVKVTTPSAIYPSGTFKEGFEINDDNVDELLEMINQFLDKKALEETTARDFARGVNPKHPAYNPPREPFSRPETDPPAVKGAKKKATVNKLPKKHGGGE